MCKVPRRWHFVTELYAFKCNTEFLQSFLFHDVKGCCHIHQCWQAVQVMAVRMRKNCVCLQKNPTEDQLE